MTLHLPRAALTPLLLGAAALACEEPFPSGKLDRDGDGFVAAERGGDDCDDRDPAINPSADEIPFNEVDEDCDGSTYLNPQSAALELGATLAVAARDGLQVAGLGGALYRLGADGSVLARVLLGPLVEEVAVAPASTIAAVGLGDAGFAIVDVDDPPEVLAQSPAPAHGLLWLGDRLYVAGGAAGLAIYDVTNPRAPAQLATRADVGTLVDLAANGSWLFAANSDLGFAAFDVTGDTIAAPVRVTLDGTAVEVALNPQNTRVYVATVTDGVAVVDVADPSAPAGLAGERFALGRVALGVVAVGDRVFVGTGRAGIDEYTAATPSAPTAHVDAAGLALTAVGTLLVAAGENDGPVLVDASVPAAPAPPLRPLAGATVNDVLLRPPWGFALAGVSGLTVFDCGDRQAPRAVARHALPVIGFAQATIGDDLLVLHQAGVRVVPLADPTTLPALMPEVPLPEEPVAIVARGSLAAVVSAGSLVLLDLSAGAESVVPVSLPLAGTRRDVALADGLAIAVGRDPALLVIDVQTPATPSVIGSWDEVAALERISVDGDRAAVLGPGGELRLLDLTTPAAPAAIGEATAAGLGRGIALAGEWLWTASDQGVSVRPVTGLDQPTTVGAAGWAEGLAIGGEVALVARLQAGVELVDLAAAAQ